MEFTENKLQVLITQAKNVAEAAHRGQKRKSGEPYFESHVQAVADAVENKLKPIAYLHDLVKIRRLQFKILKKPGFHNMFLMQLIY